MTHLKHKELNWIRARKKGTLKYHVYLYLIVVFLCWVIWGFTDAESGGLPWPLLLSLLWLLILIIHFITYRLSLMKLRLIEKEFEKLDL
ncbi:MAG: hypothetical protein QM534_06580 [Sediminibacterium sp.]|nr:hypothetical protein [Sediminibacterium sp.]